MIFKRVSLQRKKPELCYIFVNRKCLKVISSVKTKTCSALVISFLQHNNLIHKVWVDLINERQHKIQGFLGKIREFRGINLTRGQ